MEGAILCTLAVTHSDHCVARFRGAVMMALTGVTGKPHISDRLHFTHFLPSPLSVFKAEIWTESLPATTLWKLVKTAAAVIANDALNTAATDQACQLELTRLGAKHICNVCPQPCSRSGWVTFDPSFFQRPVLSPSLRAAQRSTRRRMSSSRPSRCAMERFDQRSAPL